jgi:hypothetical protein
VNPIPVYSVRPRLLNLPASQLLTIGSRGFLQELLDLEWAVPADLGSGWSSPSNRVAQTCRSVPCSTQEPMPTMTAALVAARHGQRPNTNQAWQALAHQFMRGEQTANINSYFRVFEAFPPHQTCRVVSGLSAEAGSYCLVGYRDAQPTSRWLDSGATITPVRKQPGGFRRRKLSAVVRKAITSYYTDQEQMEIEKAAKQQKISMSSFVASAALKKARRLIR